MSLDRWFRLSGVWIRRTGRFVSGEWLFCLLWLRRFVFGRCRGGRFVLGFLCLGLCLVFR